MLRHVFDRLCREYRWPRESARARRHEGMLGQACQAGTRVMKKVPVDCDSLVETPRAIDAGGLRLTDAALGGNEAASVIVETIAIGLFGVLAAPDPDCEFRRIAGVVEPQPSSETAAALGLGASTSIAEPT